MARVHAPHNHRHADDVHQHTDLNASIWSGLVAGAAFIASQMVLVMIFLGQSPWGPPRMIAAIVFGSDVLPPPPEVAARIVLAGMTIHFVLAAIYGVVLGWIVHRFDMGAALALGLGFGLGLYVVNFYLIAPSAFPWFEMARSWITIVNHLLFGALAGALYVGLRRPPARTGF